MVCNLALLFVLSFSAVSSFPTQETEKPPQPSAQASPPSQVKRIRIGGAVANSQLKHKVQPIYPQEARDQRIQGTVRLHAVLTTAGKVQQLDIISGDPMLAKAAAEAVRQWEYKPVLLNGEPVEVDTTIDVVFSLKK